MNRRANDPKRPDDLERTFAGLRCRDVLAQLSDYFDGELNAAARAQVEAHVAQCDGCTRFGGAFTATILALRARLRSAAPAPGDVAARLRQTLSAARRTR